MAENTRNVRKRELRRERDSKKRRDTFAMEYIQVKHPNIYAEAIDFYHEINTNNPGKFDLKKTQEYKNWKLNFLTKEPSTCQPITRQPATPELSTDQPATPELSTDQPATPEPSACQPSTPKSPSTFEPPSTPEQTHTCHDNLELKIPLFDKDTLRPTETLQTIAEEVRGEGTIYPSLQSEIPSDLIEKIIEELRQEPDLHDIFTNIEQQIEFEQLGEDINIDEDYRLENELMLW